MRGPKTFGATIHIELEGSAADYDSKAASSLPAIVDLGRRAPEEIAELVDRRVRVDGLLVLDPYKAVRESGPTYATVIFGPPRLEEIGEIQPEP